MCAQGAEQAPRETAAKLLAEAYDLAMSVDDARARAGVLGAIGAELLQFDRSKGIAAITDAIDNARPLLDVDMLEQVSLIAARNVPELALLAARKAQLHKQRIRIGAVREIARYYPKRALQVVESDFVKGSRAQEMALEAALFGMSTRREKPNAEDALKHVGQDLSKPEEATKLLAVAIGLAEVDEQRSVELLKRLPRGQRMEYLRTYVGETAAFAPRAALGAMELAASDLEQGKPAPEGIEVFTELCAEARLLGFAEAKRFFDRALAYAANVGDSWQKGLALAGLARELAAAKDSRAQQVFAQAKALVQDELSEVDPPRLRMLAVDVVTFDAELAKRALGASGPGNKTRTYIAMARRLLEAGNKDLALRYYRNAMSSAAWWAQAEGTPTQEKKECITDLLAIASQLFPVDKQTAREAVERAFNLANALFDPQRQSGIFSLIAVATAQYDVDLALKQAEALRTTSEAYWRTVGGIAAIVAKDDLERGLAMMRRIPDKFAPTRCFFLSQTAVDLAHRDLRRALEVARSISQSGDKNALAEAGALLGIARVLLAQGGGRQAS